jgi:succinyl-CoA synthetase beta subunit
VVVVKAQIHAGGRGKGGGVKLARSPEEARDIASKMLGMKLVTHQTGPEGQEVRTLLVEEGLPIDQEFYLGVVLDRATGRPVFMASSAGGMDIEEVAAHTPEKILKETIDPAVGFRSYQARKLAFGLGLDAALVNQAAKFMQALYHAYEQLDASLLEINPFLLTKDKRLIALDAKVNFDDNALFRTDMVARGVIEAARSIGIKVPVVVRLEGTNVEEGRRLISESGMNFTVAQGMKDAAEKVVALAGQQAA